ncbi:hypothetical protein FN846DRAFT_814114 [Sphaerosporella brunnea]|uniref:Concanavalin A-like lectin/glucanase domain-containing protein n=1 Tax=Sphaerosporella brunnea TaxID=1250544 RepID=A0A5J5ETS3_9PEZI|nr:hypothetical protein FN846DRAFT_814114 [Sphaerosporella brunnea]
MLLKTLLLILPILVSANLLLDYNAARGDAPDTLGLLNLEAARDDKVAANRADLYIKLGTDPKGVTALHVHRDKGDIRAEYHALKDKTAADKTYYIGYSFSLGTVTDNLVLFQWKEYKNTALQNIPLDLEFNGDVLEFNYQAPGTNTKRVRQWGKQLTTGVNYHIGLVINTASTGYIEIYFDGVQQKFDNGQTKVTGQFFTGQADPKFGAYRGEAVAVDTYIYQVQIGTTLEDVKSAAGIGGSTKTTTTTPSSTPTGQPACTWIGHCLGDKCATSDDCDQDWVCTGGVCATA